MGYLKRERNYLPWVVALDAFKIILGLLEAEEGDSNADERKEVYARFKRWVITLMMPYFCENGYADDLDATEEQKYLKTKMREFSCEQLEHKPCVNFENKWLKKPPKPLIDEEYCDKMIPKIVHQSDVDIDVALDVLEGCSSQVIKSPDRVEFMAKLTSKVKTGKEVKRLKEWEKKDDRSCPRGLQCYGYKWARRMIEQVGMKEEARGKCREMVFQTIKRVGGVGNNEGTLRNPRAPKKRLKTSVIRFSPGSEIKKLLPVAATLSTTYKHFSAKKCINGVTNRNLKDLCHSKRELAPWLALDYGKGAKVSVEKVVLFNRADSYAGRTKNVEMRVSNELPASGNKMFSGGKLLGTFTGPATRGQRVEIQSVTGWENTFGRYLVIQMNFGKAANYLNLLEALALGISHVAPSKIVPAAATMSTTYKHFSVKKCINGITTGSDLCHSKRERAPWLALDFGKGAKVSLEKVVLFNRREGCCWTRTKNVQIRLSNELPRSGRKIFSGGKLLGTFKGPATRGQQVEIQSAIGWENKFGRYLIIQMNFRKAPNYLNLKEIFAVGISTKK